MAFWLALLVPLGASAQQVDEEMPVGEQQASPDVAGDDRTLSEEDDRNPDRVRVVFHSTERGDEVRLSAEGHDAAIAERNEWRCEVPCTLRVMRGHYRFYYSGAGLDDELELQDDALVEAHGGNILEVVLGIGAVVIGGAILTVALVTGEGACFEFEPRKCAVGNGPLALGVGTFGVLAGLFFLLDSSGYSEITYF